MISHEATATIKRAEAVISVSVRIEETSTNPPEFRSLLRTPASLAANRECLSLYRNDEALLAACEASALSGIIFGTRQVRTHDHHRCSGYITALKGENLPPDCGEGFAIAASLATSNAVGLTTSANDLAGWEEIK